MKPFLSENTVGEDYFFARTQQNVKKS